MGTTYRTPSPGRQPYFDCNDGKSPRDQRQSSPDQISHNLPESCTSAPKGSLSHWHRLPSPKTPTFKNDTCDTLSATVLNQEIRKNCLTPHHNPQIETNCPPTSKTLTLGNGASDELSVVEKLQLICSKRDGSDEITRFISKGQQSEAEKHQETVERHVELAHELGADDSLTTLRRSSRISAKIRAQDIAQAAVAPARLSAKTAPAVQTSSPLEHNSVLFEIDPVPFESLPSLHSINWQLQYPPGGSAHPSYPYPNLDPRLIFHEHLVSLEEGLPNISQVPKLLLPMGWKHVSWSGLVPIVFDPYHQAFKLTPIGPMPLTCEELRQNGLYRYVPGGDLHPETAHLPRMMLLSDGSDGEVYDWEGIDWVLPWNGIDNALGCQNDPTHPVITVGTKTSTPDHTQTVVAREVPNCYNEGWDCPDGVIDLAEAWRWLREKEQKPSPTFNPSKGKSWRGTGIHRTSRRYKQPIGGLMAATLSTISDNLEQYLVNQDRREFCQFRSIATPVHVNIALLGDMEITLKELLCYFPNHYQWRKCADRFVRAGLNGSDIANLVNMTRDLSDDAVRKSGTIKERISYETGEDSTRVKIVRSNEEEVSYTADGWTYDTCELSDYPLLALAHGILELPRGEDTGPLTQMILWSRKEQRYDTLLGDVPAMLTEAGIAKNIQRIAEECPDKSMLVRHAEAIKEDRKRVLESEKLKRLGLEAAEEKKIKRRKTG
ncbi:Nn.00g030060.m01.CDS01 [Neocucurbitaria sp. VM-36]